MKYFQGVCWSAEVKNGSLVDNSRRRRSRSARNLPHSAPLSRSGILTGMEEFNEPNQAHAQAEAAAAALLAELKAKDAANAVAAGMPQYKMPSPYAPGEGPRDPRSSVAAPGGTEQLQSALDSSFKPVDPATIGQNTLASSHVVDFAAKIKAAQKFHGSH